MRRLIFAAFFATAIIFPSSTYGFEFCPENGCCCQWKNNVELNADDLKTMQNGVCCERKSPYEKYCSGHRRTEYTPQGQRGDFTCLCNQK